MKNKKEVESILTLLIAALITVAFVGIAYYSVRAGNIGGVGEAIDELSNSIHHADRSLDVIIENGQLVNKKYGFSFALPEEWGRVTTLLNGYEDEDIPGVMETYYWQSEGDESRYFYLVVMEKGASTKEIVAHKNNFLAQSDKFVYFYQAPRPSVSCGNGSLAALTSDQAEECRQTERIWREEIKAIILSSFNIFK